MKMICFSANYYHYHSHNSLEVLWVEPLWTVFWQNLIKMKKCNHFWPNNFTSKNYNTPMNETKNTQTLKRMRQFHTYSYLAFSKIQCEKMQGVQLGGTMLPFVKLKGWILHTHWSLVYFCEGPPKISISAYLLEDKWAAGGQRLEEIFSTIYPSVFFKYTFLTLCMLFLYKLVK